MRCVEGEIIVDKNAQSMPLTLSVDLALILGVSVVDMIVHQ